MNAGCSDTDDRLDLEGIWPEEIEVTKERVKIGDKLVILDVNRFNRWTGGFGVPVKTAVISKYPHLVYLENGMSATYTQLARYYRSNNRKRCIV